MKNDGLPPVILFATPDPKGFAGPEYQLFILTSEKQMLGKS
jgi:hypothetical protein